MLTIERASFAGHETFPFRYTWLKKAVRHIERDAAGFTRDDAMVELGVGKNMVRSIRHWALTAGLVEEDPRVPNNRGSILRATRLGRALLDDDGWDPHFEDPGTAWLLHWQLASCSEAATTWYWVFNHVPQPEFTKDDLIRWLSVLAQENRWSRVAPTTLQRDVECFIRTYVPARASRTLPLEETLDCPLVELELVRESRQRGNFVLQRGPHDLLPTAIFAFGLVTYVARYLGGTHSIPLEKIAFAPGGPGRVFALREESLLHRLEQLEGLTGGAIAFDDTAGLRQVLVRRSLDPLQLLTRYYRRRGSGTRRARW